MRRVVIESPFAGTGIWPISMFRRWANIRYARRCLHDSLMRGEAPIASHLLYTQVLDDRDSRERNIGIETGLAWLEVADAHIFYIDRGMSRGMKHTYDRICLMHRHMETRRLD